MNIDFADVFLSQRISYFADFLRANEFNVDTTAVIDIQTVATSELILDRSTYRDATKACLCRSPEDWHRFDALFDTFWQADGDELQTEATTEESTGRVETHGDSKQRLVGLAGVSEKKQQQQELLGAGDFKALSLADFRFVFDAYQMQLIEQLVDRIAKRAKKRASRREITSRTGSQVSLRKSLKHSLKTQGLPVVLSYRKKKTRPRRFVLLLDVSQSMDIYARLFMRFSRILMTVFQRSDAFVFNTELHELGQGHTKLSETDFERVLNKLGKGWLGGTKIAACLDTFIQHHLKHCVDSKTTVVIFSDGCDTAPPQELAERVKVIQRCAGKLIWVNPLLGRFEPGEADKYMDPVIPFVDSYCSAHNLDSLPILEQELLS